MPETPKVKDLLFNPDGIKLEEPIKVTAADVELAPIEPRNFLEGDPQTKASVLFQRSSEGKKFFAGFWSCEEGVLNYVPEHDSVAYILEGEVEIEPESGEPFKVEAGDVVASPKGVGSTWHYLKPFKEFVVVAD